MAKLVSRNTIFRRVLFLFVVYTITTWIALQIGECGISSHFSDQSDVEQSQQTTAERIIYLYHSNFTEFYQTIHNCEFNRPVQRFGGPFQHMPDFYFFNALKADTININGTNVNIVNNIHELDLYPSIKEIIFVVPIWNDVFAAMFLKWHITHLYKFKLSKCINKVSYQAKYHIRGIRNELKHKMLEFDHYINMHPSILFKYITIFHGWFYNYRSISSVARVTSDLYVKNNMSIIHYERNVVEGMWGISQLFKYKPIIVAPYMSGLYLLPSKVVKTHNYTTYDLYFSGGIRQQMLGSTLRIKACRLNKLKTAHAVIRYSHVKEMNLVMKYLRKAPYNWTKSEIKIRRNCLQENYVSGKFNDETYLKELKQSRFCLFFRGDSYSSRRFYDVIYANCIPIVVSDEFLNYAAPFKNVIDYHKMCYFIKEKAFEANPTHEITKILQLKHSEWSKKLHYIKENKHHLIWVGNNSEVTQNIFSSLFTNDGDI